MLAMTHRGGYGTWRYCRSFCSRCVESSGVLPVDGLASIGYLPSEVSDKLFVHCSQEGHSRPVYDVAFHPDGSLCCTR